MILRISRWLTPQLQQKVLSLFIRAVTLPPRDQTLEVIVA